MRRINSGIVLVFTFIAATAAQASLTYNHSGGRSVATAPSRLEGIKVSGSVILVNNAFDHVKVEVRKGANSNVNQLPVYEVRTMGKGKWPIPCSADEGFVWWRRDANPDHPDGRWSGWTSKACFGKDEEVSL